MDILSLPEEMLASVLKYSDFKDLTEIRKGSSKVDLVAKRYNLNRVKMNSLRLIKFYEEIEVSLSCKETNTSYSQEHSSLTVGYVLKCYLPKIRDLKCLQIHNSDFFGKEENSLSTEVADLILGKTCKKITCLHIQHFDLTMSFDKMKNIIYILTKLKLNDVSIYSPFSNFELSDKLLENIECNSLRLRNKKNDSKLTLSCLDKLCSRKLPHNLVFAINNSTVSELGQFFEKHLPYPVASTVRWSLDVDKGAMAIDEIQPYFSGLKCFRSLNVNILETENSIDLAVFADDPYYDPKICIGVHL